MLPSTSQEVCSMKSVMLAEESELQYTPAWSDHEAIDNKSSNMCRPAVIERTRHKLPVGDIYLICACPASCGPSV